MLLMKACDKCSGSLLVEEEGRLLDLVCLQCGFRPADGSKRAERLVQAREQQRRAARAARYWTASAAG